MENKKLQHDNIGLTNSGEIVKSIDTNIGLTNSGEIVKSIDANIESTEDIQIVVARSNRPKFVRKIDFLLSCIGFSVGLGNVWRFPYLCYKNGGATFLIPYFIAALFGGVSLFTLEILLGQFMSKGGIECWNICPLFKGIGYGTIVVLFLLNCYYNVIMAWGFHYLFASMTYPLPWSTCGNWWNTDRCFEIDQNVTNITNTAANNLTDSVTEYWERRVLNISTSIDDVGNIRWDLALCLLLAWIVVFFCIFKGVKTSGKILYITATSPYILMLILLIRAATLDGALEGLNYLFQTKDWSRLNDMQVWVDAGTQIFFSYSIALGTLPSLGSFNEFKTNSFRDGCIFAAVNSFTSLLAGTIIFMTLGHMAQARNMTIDQVADKGPGLAFVAYPQALAVMPGSTAWSILFFIMFILLGLDSQFVGVEGFITAVSDLLPKIFNRKHGSELFTLGTVIVMFFVGLFMVTNGGLYVFMVFDHYAASKMILLIAVLECIVVVYIYGAGRFRDNIKMMLGFNVGYIPHILWGFISPVLLMTIFVLCCLVYKRLDYKRGSTKEIYDFPTWSIIMGWMMAGMSTISVPSYMLYILVKTPGTFRERLQKCIRPQLNAIHQLRPKDSCKDLIQPKSCLSDRISQSDINIPKTDYSQVASSTQPLASSQYN